MKTTVLFISILFVINCSYGQVSFGIKSGINIATVKDINSDPVNRIGWHAGALANIPIHKKISVQPELLFSSKGYRYIGDLNETNKSSIRLNYLTAPILLSYKIDYKTSLFLGPEIGYLLSAYLLFPNKEKFNVSNNYPVKLDLGLDIGLSYKIIKKVGLEILYNYGFKNMYITDAVGVRIGERLAGNRVFQLGCFYSFASFKKINNHHFYS